MNNAHLHRYSVKTTMQNRPLRTFETLADAYAWARQSVNDHARLVVRGTRRTMSAYIVELIVKDWGIEEVWGEPQLRAQVTALASVHALKG